MIKVRPEMKRTLPRARRAPSKKSMTPRSMKRPPKVVRATPIFCASDNHMTVFVPGKDRWEEIRQSSTCVVDERK